MQNYIFLLPSSNLIGEGEDKPDLQKARLYIQEKSEDKEVQQFLNDIRPINDDVVGEYLTKNESGKKLYTRLLDKETTTRVNNAIANYEKEKLPGKIEEAIKKVNPDETEEQKELRLQREEIENLKKQNKMNDVRSNALKLMNELSLPFGEVVDSFITEDLETTAQKIQNFKAVFDKVLNSETEKIKSKLSGREMNDEPSATDYDKLTQELEEAKKAKNLPLVVKLTRLIAEKKK